MGEAPNESSKPCYGGTTLHGAGICKKARGLRSPVDQLKGESDARGTDSEKLLQAIEDYDFVSELVCESSPSDQMVDDDRRIFVFDDHSGAALSPSSGLLAADVEYVIEVEVDDDDDDDE